MFSYYGSKSKIIQYYPSPRYDTIIEPFAGSARYSLKYYGKNIWINDAYKTITDIWNWIINATPEQINSIPILKKGDKIDDLTIDPALKLLLGFVVNSGVAYPRKTVTKWCEEKGEFKRHINRLLEYVGKLNHWKVTNLDYRELPDIEATWFIDPPYQKANERYKIDNINYKELADWCMKRKGQVIVCENDNADWLPFQPLKEMRGQKHRTLEVVWVKD